MAITSIVLICNWHINFSVNSVKLNENLEAHFFFPDFIYDVEIVEERKTCFGLVADPPFSIPRQLLVFIITIKNWLEVTVPWKKTVLDRYKNHSKNTFLHVSDNVDLSRSFCAQFCDYELSYTAKYEKKYSFLRRKGKLNSCGVCLTTLKICRSRNLIGIRTSGRTGH